MVFSKAATSLMCNFSNGNFPKVMSGPPRRLSLQWGPRATARPDLGSFRLGNCTFEKLPLGKIPLENCHMGKNYFFNICCHNTSLRTCLAFLKASALAPVGGPSLFILLPDSTINNLCTFELGVPSVKFHGALII